VTAGDEAATGVDLEVELQRARVLLGLGRTAEATQALASLIGRRPDDPRAWRELARARLAGGDLPSALEAARSAITLDPGQSTGYLLASNILNCQGEPKQAEQMARQGLRIDPGHWGAHAMLGVALSNPVGRRGSRRRRREAVAAGRRGVSLAPDLAAAHASLGAIAAATGDREGARTAFHRALALDPHNSAVHNDLARLQVLRPLRTPQRLAAAAAGFSSAVVADPASTVSRANLERVMYSAVSTTSYLVFLIAWLLRPGASTDQILWRVIPVVALAAPAVFAWRFWSQLTPSLRDYLRYLVTRSQLRGSCALACISVACILVGSVVPHGPRQVLTGSAVVIALTARLWLVHCTRRRSGASGPMIRTTVLWLLVLLGAGTTVVMFLAAPGQPDPGPELGAGALCAAGTLAGLVLIARRRAMARTPPAGGQPSAR